MKRKRRQRSASQPSELERSLARATEWHQRGRLDRAEMLYRQILRVAPDHADTLYLLGTLYHQQGHHRQAVEHLQPALRHFQRSATPALAAVGFSLGNACFELGRHADAAAAYRAALAVAPDDPELLNNLGNALSADGRHDQAVACYRRGVALQPRHTGMWRNLAAALRHAGQLREASAACREILRFQPDDSYIGLQLAELLQLTGQDQAAIDQYRKLLGQSPERAETHFALGVCLQRLGRFEEAVAHLWRAVELHPELAEAHYNLATNRHFRPDADYPARLAALADDTALDEETRAQRFSHDLDHLAGVYRDYQRLMAHWRAILPLELLEVDYERLIHEPESSIRTMLSFCGLERDDRCLDFHRNARPVATASFWQVRQPLYTDAIGRWRRYRRHLQPLLKRFEQHDISQCTDVNS